MLSEFIEKIQELAFTEVKLNGRTLSTSKLHPVRDPEPEPLRIHTLQGIVDAYRSKNVQELDPFCFAYVQDFARVDLVGEIRGVEMQRRQYAVSMAYPHSHCFDKYVPLDTFLIYLQTSFVKDETTAKILKVLGNLVQGSEIEFADDGVTQHVTARTGITRREIIDLPNPIELRPFRTFPEIEQPKSKFVLRIKGEKDSEQPGCMLSEADGGGWKNECVENLKAFFKAADVPVIG